MKSKPRKKSAKVRRQSARTDEDVEPLNAILGAVLAELRPLSQLLLLPGTPLRQSEMEFLFPNLATLERKLGRLLLDAVLVGLTEFPRSVQEAIKQAASVFLRDKETNLLPDFLRFVSKQKAGLTKGELRQAYEDSVTKQRGGDTWTLEPRQWRILRDAVGVQWLREGKSGRPQSRRKTTGKAEPQPARSVAKVSVKGIF